MVGLETPPRILVIDDLFGRTLPDRRNEDRANLCGQYLLEDVTGDETDQESGQRIKTPVAQAVFHRGQTPSCSTPGDVVENDLEGTLRAIRKGWNNRPPDTPRWAMVLLDLCFYTGRVTESSERERGTGMPKGQEGDDDPSHYFGLRILKAIHEHFPDLPVVILSSKAREDVSRDFSRYGALGFLPRNSPQSPDKLQDLLWRHGLLADEQGEVIGRSKPLLMALRAARRVSTDQRHLLLRGERGTGKELLARYVHRQAEDRKQRPFVTVDSPVLSPELFASELFGITEGAATDVQERTGKMTEADGGDLFLDEIKDMAPQVQAGILRVLQEREFTPVGANQSQSVDMRVLSATNADIEAHVASGSFRRDLLDRLCEGGTIVLPPLRDRKEDLPLLVEHFVREAEAGNSAALRRAIEPEALQKLREYDWPGNIRELRTCLFNAVNSHPDVEHLVPVHLQFPQDGEGSAIRSTEEDHRLLKEEGRGDGSPSLADTAAATSGPFVLRSSDREILRDSLQDLQVVVASYLEAALRATADPLSGDPSPTKAFKLLTEKEAWGANPTAQGYDLFKRLLKLGPGDVEEALLADPSLLKQVYEKAEEER